MMACSRPQALRLFRRAIPQCHASFGQQSRFLSPGTAAVPGDVNGSFLPQPPAAHAGNPIGGRGYSEHFARLQTPEQLVDVLRKSSRLQRSALVAHVCSSDAPPALRSPAALSSLIKSLSVDLLDESVGSDDLALLGRLVEACPEPWAASEVCRALSGLKLFSESLGTTELQTSLWRRLEACPPDAPFSAADLSAALSGMRWSSSVRQPVVRRLFESLAVRLAACPEPMSVKQVTVALSGLKGSRSSTAGAREVLEELLPRLAAAGAAAEAGTCTVDPRDVSEGLRGLMGSSSDDPAVRAALSALLPIIHACPDEMYPGFSVGLLESFRFLSSEHAEVRAALMAVVPKLDASEFVSRSKTLTHNFARAAGFLASANSDHAEVRFVLAVLASKHAEVAGRMEGPRRSSLKITGVLRLLGGCSSEYAEVRAFLRELTPCITSCSSQLDVTSFFSALRGLRRLRPDCSEVRDLLAALTPLAAASAPLFSPDTRAALLGTVEHLRGGAPGGGDFAEVRGLVEAIEGGGQEAALLEGGLRDF